MPSLGTKPAVNRRSYISINSFNNDVYNYSCGLNESLLREVGTLSHNPLANSDNCPSGRILHENGRKLNPSDVYFPGANSGVNTYMVGVYDPVSFISGFINPNSPNFSVYSTDTPTYLSQAGSDPNSGAPNLANGLYADGSLRSIVHSNEYQEITLSDADETKYAGMYYNGGDDISIQLGAGTGYIYLGGNSGDIHASRNIDADGNFTADGYVAATGTILSKTAVGYATGCGGTVTQLVNKDTDVTLNKPSGLITMNNQAMNVGDTHSFILTNSFIGANDVIVANSTFTNYTINAYLRNGGSCSFFVTKVRGSNGETLSIPIWFSIIRGAVA